MESLVDEKVDAFWKGVDGGANKSGQIVVTFSVKKPKKSTWFQVYAGEVRLLIPVGNPSRLPSFLPGGNSMGTMVLHLPQVAPTAERSSQDHKRRNTTTKIRSRCALPPADRVRDTSDEEIPRSTVF